MPVVATVFSIVFGLLRFFEIALLVWVILSWVPLLTARTSVRWRYRGFFNFLETLEHFLRLLLGPLLRLARRILPRRVMPHEWQFIDLSPIIVFLMIELTRAVLVWVYGLILSRVM